MTGIDTDAGKSLVSAILCLGLDADYWKPVQAGITPHTDTEWIQRVTEREADRFLPEAYRLDWPASPHAAAAKQHIRISAEMLSPPSAGDRPLLIEGAGGLMVPLRADYMFIDLLEEWQLPVVLVIRTYLGSINHSLLSLEALQKRNIPLYGIVFNDGGRPESKSVIAAHAHAPVLGNVPKLERVNKTSLLAAWQSGFLNQKA